MLPKIHKSLVEVPGRPVVSISGTPTERISEFVDYHINPIVKVLPIKGYFGFPVEIGGVYIPEQPYT